MTCKWQTGAVLVGTSHRKSLHDRDLGSILNALLWLMDSVCATLFHSNVNRVSPNRTILAGEKVGIAWLLPKQPGVDWYGFLFPAFLWLRLLQVWACLHCASCYAKPSFVKSAWPRRPRSQSCALAPAATAQSQRSQWGSAQVPQTHPCASDGRTGAVAVGREQLCCCPQAKLSGMIYKQQQQQQSGVFSAWTGFTPLWREL